MKFTLLSLFLFFFLLNSNAQGKSKTLIKSETAPLTYQAYWGPVKSGVVSSSQIKSTAQAPLVVRDNNKHVYEVVGFRISYVFKETVKDELSGELKTINDLRVSDFSDTNSLSIQWFESIRDNVKHGDQIIFSKILFKTPVAKRLLAPDIRITVD
jgi:hypothetical protein